MTALITLDSIIEPTAGALLNAEGIFGTGQVETILTAIETQVRSTVIDISTPEGREATKSLAYKIARSKTTLDDIGKEHVAAIKAQSAKIDAERRVIRDRLDSLKEEVRKPVTEWEAAETQRVADHEAALVSIIESPALCQTWSSADIRAYKAKLEELAGRDWQEFGDRAIAAFSEVMPKVVALRDAAEQRERDQAELEALRREKAERDARERAEAEAKAAAERAQHDAEQAAARERVRAEQAEREKAEAVARAVEEERQRAEAAQAAAVAAERRRQEEEARRLAAEQAAQEAAERKRQDNKRHRERVHAKISGALIEFLGDADAKLVIDAIASGSIPYVSINY